MAIKAIPTGGKTFASVRLKDGATAGPVTIGQLRKLFVDGRLAPDSMLAETGEADAKPLHFFFDLDTWTPLTLKDRASNAMRFRLGGIFIVGTSIVMGVQMWNSPDAGLRRWLGLALMAVMVVVYANLFSGVGRTMALWLCGWTLVDAAIEYSRAGAWASHVPMIAQAVTAVAITGMLFPRRANLTRDVLCFTIAVGAFAVESFIA